MIRRIVIPLLVLNLISGGFSSHAIPQSGLDNLNIPSSGSHLFIESAGQFGDSIRYQVWGEGQLIWLASNSLLFSIKNSSIAGTEDHLIKYRDEPSLPTGAPLPMRGVNIAVSFPGANPHPILEPFNKLETRVSYFTGSNPAQWETGVRVWSGVRYKEIYPGIDLLVSSQNGQLSLQLIAPPGVDRSVVRMLVRGADTIELDDISMRLTTAVGELRIPLIQDQGYRQPDLPSLNIQPAGIEITSPFSSSVSVGVPDSSALILQNEGLMYSTFLEGHPDLPGNYTFASSVAVDRDGAAYITGTTYVIDPPVSPGLSEMVDTPHAFVFRYKPFSTTLDYMAFIGGSSADYGSDIVVDSNGAAYIVGGTDSNDFPVTPGANDQTYASGGDGFVVKLNPAGSEIVFASYIGGTGADSSSHIRLGPGNSVLVAGSTLASDFPTTPTAFGTTHNGSWDGFVLRLSPSGSDLEYSTFIGGSADDGISGLAVDVRGFVYITGDTDSSDFPITPRAFDTTENAVNFPEVFVAKVSRTGTGLEYSTYLVQGSANGIAVDGNNQVYVVGRTVSTFLPVTEGAFDTSCGTDGACNLDATNNPSLDGFVAKFNSSGSNLVFATYLGGSSFDYPENIYVDKNGNASIIGEVESIDFPVTQNAIDATHNGFQDVFIARLDRSGKKLLYSTYLGGTHFDHGVGITEDRRGAIFITGWTESNDFPVTPLALDPEFGGEVESFLSIINSSP